jgi:uncharacterized protein YihD (DUF1040 family)
MKKRGKPATKRESTAFESCFTAFQFIGAFSLSQLLEYPYVYLVVLIPLLACEGVLVGAYLLKLKKKYQTTDETAVEKDLPKPEAPKLKPKVIAVEKAEVGNDALKFSVLQGFFRRRWVAVKEIPLYEITQIETVGNELNVTWNDTTDAFFMKKKAASFGKLPEEVNTLILEHQKMLEFNEKSALRKNELLGALNASIGTVDLSFDLLISLQVKRINWQQLEATSKGFGSSLSFMSKTLPPLSLDFSGISGAIERQVPKETSGEAFDILKSIYAYFNDLKPEEDINETHPNFKNAKDAIFAYYTLNDLLLGKIAGEKDSKKESLALETVLQSLAKETNVRVNFEELTDNINKISLDDRESVIEDSREIFKEQLKNIDRPIEQPLIAEPPTEQAPIAQPESTPPPEPQEPPQPSTQQPADEQQQVVQPSTEPAPIEQPETMPPPEPLEPMEPTKPPEPAVEPSTEPAAVEPQEAAQPSTEQPSMEQQEPTQAEATLPESETTTKPSEPPPKKKSLARRLRKTILGY